MSRNDRRSALEKFKRDRQGLGRGLDDLEEKDDDIYDYVEEDEYHQLVEARREREDFVVDDDGLGYYDDGEERFGEDLDAHEATSKKRSSVSANATLTQKAIKKARKDRLASASQPKNNATGNTSMWQFLNKANTANNTEKTTNNNTKKSNKPQLKVDELLAQLDEPLTLQKSHQQGPSRRHKRQPVSRGSRFTQRRPVVARPVTMAPVDEQDEDVAPPMDYDDDDDNDNNNIHQDHHPQEENDVTLPESPSNKSVTLSSDVKPPSEDTAPKRRLAKPKLGQISKPALQAMQAQEQKQKEQLHVQEQVSTTPIDTTAVNFQPTLLASSDTGVSVSTAGQINLQEVLVAPDNYVDFFYMDIKERNGDILLFGKVLHQQNYVSACVLVTGNKRNLFVLPREGAGMKDVHAEVNDLLTKTVLGRSPGATWAAKPVQRRYAFDDPSLPREETDYLKVVYDAKHSVPPEDSQGEHIAKILGTGASVVENFILKRKLMGPCWIRIRQPQSTRAPMSWCKVEMTVEDPKNLKRLDIEEPGAVRPPPPVVTMTLKLKTVANPKTHKSEIVSISVVCHKHVNLETASDESPKYMTQLSLIRPLTQFPRDLDHEISAKMPYLKKEANERAMLSRLMAQIGLWDPDVIVGHNVWGFDMEVVLARCAELKVNTWSKLGRRRRTEFPNKTHISSRKDLVIADALAGRLLCDTYLSAKELLRETTYSLTNLAATQLKTKRQEIEQVDVPQWFQSGKTIVQLALSTLFDAQLVQRLMFKLQCLPLTKQLTCIAGNMWSHTLKSNRAERTEYLLLHEFHSKKFLPPEKRRRSTDGNGKAKYSGGLVLEPKRGLYDSFILLLDFNSLYPSIIQEYNLCFTTIDWAQHVGLANDGDEKKTTPELPPLPDEAIKQGVLPRVIKNLVDRRRAVKKLLKSEKAEDKKQELDIRQKALKLTANSMYGCLGFSNSRFYAQPIAALVTAMGRETLQRSVDIAQTTVGLDVIYGDTDSIMINTRMNQEEDLPEVKRLGEKVKYEVNKCYKTLELEIDGIFRSMLLLKKKKYAAKTVEEQPDGTIKYGEELKGLDLVRRDWCIQSKDTGRYVTEQILSGEDSENVIQNIHSHLEELAKKMRSGHLPLEKYVITKGLSKHPNDYPDGKSQPHVHVAKMMLKNDRAVNTGDHIPYVITAPIEHPVDKNQPIAKALSAAERARHPEEITRSKGGLKPDIEWYLTQQILPPIARLCEPIEGTSQQILAEKLGLDASKFNAFGQYSGFDDDMLIDYTPASCLSDSERFKDVEKLMIYCEGCGEQSEFPGVVRVHTDSASGVQTLVSGLRCTSPDCNRPDYWGSSSPFAVMSKVANTMRYWVKSLEKKYYEGRVCCDEPSCGLETPQVSVAGCVCLSRGCKGRIGSILSERTVHTHLKYLETLVSVEHACEHLQRKKLYGNKSQVQKHISKVDRAVFAELHDYAVEELQNSAFHWITPSLWQGLMHFARQ